MPYRINYILIALVVPLQALVVPWLGDRVHGGKLFALVLVAMAAAFAGLRKAQAFEVTRRQMLLFVLLLVLAVSVPFAAHPWPAFQLLAVMGILALISLLVANGIEADRGFSVLVKALLCGGVVFSLLGLYEYFSFLFLGPSRRMLIPYLLPPNMHIRVGGIYGQPNLFALFLCLSILAFLYYYLHLAPNSGRKAVHFLPLALVSTVFFLTGSRAGVLGMLITFGVLGWLALKGRYLSQVRAARKVLLCCCLVMVFAYVAALNLHHVKGIFSQAASGTAGRILVAVPSGNLQLASSSTDDRLLLWTASILIFLDQPLSGCGFGNFKFMLPHYTREAHELLGFLPYEAMVYTKWAHNELLQFLSEGGIFAFLLLAWVFFDICRIAWRGDASSSGRPYGFFIHLMMVPIIIQAMFEWPLREPGMAALFFVLFGLAGAATQEKYLVRINQLKKAVFSTVLACTVIFSGFLLFKELQLGAFNRKLARAEEIQTTFPYFEQLTNDTFLGYRVLLGALPRYTSSLRIQHDSIFAEKLLPHSEQLVAMQGSQWQWFDFATLAYIAGDAELAASAVQHAIDLQPTHQASWQLQHLLNMEQAAKASGRPLSEFRPIPPKGNIDFSELIEFRNEHDKSEKNQKGI